SPTMAEAMEALPRLVVVIDEFASLASDLPDFLDALVGIAQRGRSLGVHLVLATQRPAGVVTEDIRANTTCRIALRVTRPQDSTDVVDSPDAAKISRRLPGRALARLGPGEIVAFQSAMVTGRTAGRPSIVLREMPEADGDAGNGPIATGSPHPRVVDSSSGGPVSRGAAGEAAEAGDEGGHDLDRIVVAVERAHRRMGGRRPRTPWPEPLPDDLALGALGATSPACPAGRDGPDPDRVRPAAGRAAAWLVDDPDRQTTRLGGWSVGDGHLVVVAGPGAGSTTTLMSVVLDLCRRCSPDRLHIHLVDMDADRLAPLLGLPHVGSVIGPADGERRRRLLGMLSDELARRRAEPPAASSSGRSGDDRPDIVLVVDGFAGLAREHDPVREPAVHDAMTRIWADGPAVGVWMAVSVGRAADLPPTMIASAGVVLVQRTADTGDALRFGARVDTSRYPPGRAIDVTDGLELQVARVPGGCPNAAVSSIAARWPSGGRPPWEVGVLARRVPERDLPRPRVHEDGRLDLVVGIDDQRLEPLVVTLHPREHLVVLGPPRSGRTNLLALLGRSLRGREASSMPHVVVVGGAASGLAELVGADPVDPGDLGEVVSETSPGLVLVDDADRMSDPNGALGRLLAHPPVGTHVVAASTADRIRAGFGHWSADLRFVRSAVLFRPCPLDVDLVGATLPPRLELPPIPGRGVVVVDGIITVAQVAHVDGCRRR
ncbi:MAG: FtsK/SpoIIIE domain-containing protein, partial [Acidimicrobiales bacterium]